MGRPSDSRCPHVERRPTMSSERKAKPRNNARTSAARAIQKREGLPYRQAVARADAAHKNRTTFQWDPSACRRSAAALNEAHAALLRSGDQPELQKGAEYVAWLTQALSRTRFTSGSGTRLDDERPPFPTGLPINRNDEGLANAAASLRDASLALDDGCSGQTAAAFQNVLSRLQTWCTQG